MAIASKFNEISFFETFLTKTKFSLICFIGEKFRQYRKKSFKALSDINEINFEYLLKYEI
jgi:hypothetical protein